MTDGALHFGSGRYWVIFALLFIARGMDFLSTWVATPNLVLEGNPLAKKMGWKLGALVWWRQAGLLNVAAEFRPKIGVGCPTGRANQQSAPGL